MKSKIISVLFLILALASIWTLVKLWIPSGYTVAGHDSGLALNAKDFLLTRLNAWDDRINFGVDNSPHFGSLVMHSIDYLLAIAGGTLYSGNQVAVSFWLSIIFVSALIFSLTVESVVGKYFKFFFPIFATFNFYIFQSIFILERAKYELYSVSLIFLALIFKVLKARKKSIIKYSIVFSILLSIFNGGSWFGFPLYGGFLVTCLVIYFSVLFLSLKRKNYSKLSRLSFFYVFNFVFFLFLNAYSILPYLATFSSSAYSQLVDVGTIQSGAEWLKYISRGSSFLNLFKLQGIPDWYLTEFLPNVQHAYSTIYMTNFVLILISTAFPVIGFSSLLLTKKKKEKHIIGLAVLLLLMSMFFAAGTNSPLGFIYDFLYRKIPGFSAFRSPYFKFGYAYIISFMFLLAFSLSKGMEFMDEKLKTFVRAKVVIMISIVIFGWFGFHYVIFNSQRVFTWQTGKSTLVKVPSYVNDFDNWINNQRDINGRILLLPPLDNTWMVDYYSWGYWSLSTLPSVTFFKGDFITNDTNLISEERGWVAELYSLLEKGNFTSFEDLASRLDVKYILLRKDFVLDNSYTFSTLILQMDKDGKVQEIKNFGEWTLYSLADFVDKPIIYSSVDFAKISDNYFYFPKELSDREYSKYSWLKFEETEPIPGLNSLTKKEFYNISCSSCEIENLSKYAQVPPVRILPNSLFYVIKKDRQERLIEKASDEKSRLSLYLEFILTKLSEIKSMENLNVDKRYVLIGLNDMLNYLNKVNVILDNSEKLRNDFYIASSVYKKLNPVQRHFRDVIAASNFQYENEDIRETTIKILWQINLIKKYFNPHTSQNELWSHEKLYRLNNLDNGVYKLLIDTESLPVDNEGLTINPEKLATDLGQEITINQRDSSRWLETENFEKKENIKELQFTFPQQPNLFLSKELQLQDFPEGERGCLVGGISHFNKNKIYRIRLQSSVGRKNIRLYIDEKGKSGNGFLQGDIVTDVFLANPDSFFEYVFDPKDLADNPSIYLCESDASLPGTETIEVYEMFSPIVFAERNVSDYSPNPPKVSFEKKNASNYKVTVTDASDPFVLVFNHRFNFLWKLLDSNGKVVSSHFSVDGYANGWLLSGKKDYNLSLEYYPEILFKYGVWISLASLATSLIIYMFIDFRKRNGKTNK